MQTIFYSIVVAIAYSIYSYVQKTTKEDPEKFDVAKFGKTVFAGFIVGVFLYTQGYEVTPENVYSLLASGFVTVIVDRAVTIFSRLLSR